MYTGNNVTLSHSQVDCSWIILGPAPSRTSTRASIPQNRCLNYLNLLLLNVQEQQHYFESCSSEPSHPSYTSSDCCQVCFIMSKTWNWPVIWKFLIKTRQGIRTSTLGNNEELIFKNTLNFPSLEGKQQVSDIKQRVFEIRPAVSVCGWRTLSERYKQLYWCATSKTRCVGTNGYKRSFKASSPVAVLWRSSGWFSVAHAQGSNYDLQLQANAVILWRVKNCHMSRCIACLFGRSPWVHVMLSGHRCSRQAHLPAMRNPNLRSTDFWFFMFISVQRIQDEYPVHGLADSYFCVYMFMSHNHLLLWKSSRGSLDC